MEKMVLTVVSQHDMWQEWTSFGCERKGKKRGKKEMSGSPPFVSAYIKPSFLIDRRESQFWSVHCSGAKTRMREVGHLCLTATPIFQPFWWYYITLICCFLFLTNSSECRVLKILQILLFLAITGFELILTINKSTNGSRAPWVKVLLPFCFYRPRTISVPAI